MAIAFDGATFRGVDSDQIDQVAGTLLDHFLVGNLRWIAKRDRGATAALHAGQLYASEEWTTIGITRQTLPPRCETVEVGAIVDQQDAGTADAGADYRARVITSSGDVLTSGVSEKDRDAGAYQYVDRSVDVDIPVPEPTEAIVKLQARSAKTTTANTTIGNVQDIAGGRYAWPSGSGTYTPSSTEYLFGIGETADDSEPEGDILTTLSGQGGFTRIVSDVGIDDFEFRELGHEHIGGWWVEPTTTTRSEVNDEALAPRRPYAVQTSLLQIAEESRRQFFRPHCLVQDATAQTDVDPATYLEDDEIDCTVKPYRRSDSSDDPALVLRVLVMPQYKITASDYTAAAEADDVVAKLREDAGSVDVSITLESVQLQGGETWSASADDSTTDSFSGEDLYPAVKSPAVPSMCRLYGSDAAAGQRYPIDINPRLATPLSVTLESSAFDDSQMMRVQASTTIDSFDEPDVAGSSAQSQVYLYIAAASVWWRSQ